VISDTFSAPPAISTSLGAASAPPGSRRTETDSAAPLLVYVHFPWCLEKCPYCDFVSEKIEREAIDHEAYERAVIRELEARTVGPEAERRLGRRRLVSVFFGGGTPSLWATASLGRVLAAIRARFDEPAPGEPPLEVTVECNPSSLDQEKATALADVGVTRLSIGVQSLAKDRLAFLGRLHDDRGALAALEGAVRSGIGRVSGDLLFGVAGQSPEVAADEARRIADTGVTHVSAYNLTIEAGTKFGQLAKKGRLPLADEGHMVESFFAVEAALGSRGLGHYEISNYGAPGCESRHNLGYWRGLDYLALGTAAVGALAERRNTHDALRYRNDPDVRKYVRAAAEAHPDNVWMAGGVTHTVEELDAETRLRERIMLGLRLREGLDLEAAAAALGVAAWTQDREKAAKKLIARGRLRQNEGRLQVPPEAWIFADGVAAELF
jgi:putative oxygen-independent coproporphyrinogen III oxidase